jgi:uncharacterized ion transporter superfamily protein YfcC
MIQILNDILGVFADGWNFGGTEAIFLLLGVIVGVIIKESELRKMLGIPSDLDTVEFIAALVSRLGADVKLQVLIELAEKKAEAMTEPDAITAAKAKAAKLQAKDLSIKDEGAGE